MLYFLHGDIVKAADKANALAETMLKKQPEASHFKLDPDNFSLSQLQELVGGQGLFTQKYIVSLRRLLEEKETQEGIFSFLEEIADSENIFIWAEGLVDAKAIEKIEKVATKVQEFKVTAPKKKEEPNLFGLGDALGARDKKKLWLGYTDALMKADANQIHGILFWQVKNMVLAKNTSSADEAGITAFPYKKAKQHVGNYKDEELETMLDELVALTHDAKRGGKKLELSLERWVLGV
jgi:DNA polymerase III delta subunit